MPPQNTEFKIEDIVKNPQIGSRFSLKNEAGRTLGYKAIENITPTQGGLKIIQFGGDIDTTGQKVLQGGKQTAIVNAQGQFIDPTGRPTNTPSYWNNPQQGIKLAMDVQKFGTAGASPITGTGQTFVKGQLQPGAVASQESAMAKAGGIMPQQQQPTFQPPIDPKLAQLQQSFPKATPEELQNLLTATNQSQQQQQQSITHQVQSGDTLSAIARANGVSVDDITGYRSGNPDLIFPGEQLTIKKYTAPVIQEAGTDVKTDTTTGVKIDAKTGAPAIIPADDPANKYNTDTGELNPNYEPPLTDTQKGYAAHLAENTQTFIYDQIKQELGLDDLKTSPAETSKAIQAVEDEKSAKIADINSNPWLSDGQRLASLRRNEAKFAGRLQNLEDQLSREQKLYQDGVAEAQWKSKLIVDQYNNDRSFYYQAKKDAADLAAKDKETKGVLTEAGGKRLLIDPTTGETIKDLGIVKTGIISPTIDESTIDLLDNLSPEQYQELLSLGLL